MKKLLLLIGLAICVNMMFAQGTATISVGTINDPAVGPISVPFTLDALSNPDGFPLPDLISGFALYCWYDASVLELGNTIPVLAIHMDSYWTTQGSYVVNMIPDNPAPGWNTIALVWATGGVVAGTPPQSLANVDFNYLGGGTVMGWGELVLKGQDADVKSGSYMVDYDGLDYILTENDGFVGTSGPLAKVWDGGGDGVNWLDPLNWNPDGLPGDGDEVIINADGKAPMVIITGGPATTGTLTVAAGAGIQIDPTGSLTTNGLYTNNGNLLITSDATGAAGSFIDLGGLTGTGTYEFDRFVSASLNEDEGWHFVSSPVNNSVSADLTAYWLKEWQNDPPLAPFVPTYSDLDDWTYPCGYSLGNVALNVMQGYSVKENLNYEAEIIIPAPCPTGLIHNPNWPLAQDNFVKFGGDEYAAGVPMTPSGFIWAPGATTMPALMINVNTGPYSANVNWLNAGVFGQWNLLGNPYSAPIDNALFTAGFPAQVNASIHFYDDLNMTWAVWASGVGAPQIPATQGFMVEVNTPGFSGPVALTNAMRTHMGAGMYYKSEINDLLTLQATGNGLADKTYVRFLDEAEVGFDRVFDAHKMFSTAQNVPQIYTTAGAEMLAINALPATDMVPMSFTAKTNGSYTIEAIETSNFNEVYLQDLQTFVVTDLLAGSHEITYTGEVQNFIIHFAPVGINEINANTVKIWARDNYIIVNVPVDVTGEIAVYNMMGQEVIRTDIESFETQIPVSDVNTNYIVKVISNSNAVTGKVYVK